MMNKGSIRCGKVVELLPKQSSGGYVARYGIQFGKRVLSSIKIYANEKTRSFTYFNNGISTIKDVAGCTSIRINNGEPKANEVEDTLIVILPCAQYLSTTAERIDKKSFGEAVVFMHVGDTVELAQTPKGKTFAYTVVQNKNKLFLVKKNR